jgi:hypothetical protein
MHGAEPHFFCCGMIPCAQQLFLPPTPAFAQPSPPQILHSAGQQMRDTGLLLLTAAVVYHEVPRMVPVGQLPGGLPAVGGGVGGGGGDEGANARQNDGGQ